MTPVLQQLDPFFLQKEKIQQRTYANVSMHIISIASCAYSNIKAKGWKQFFNYLSLISRVCAGSNVLCCLALQKCFLTFHRLNLKSSPPYSFHT